jgi:hypothetical protein
MNFAEDVLFYSWFTPDFLERELKRLFELFFPHEAESLDVRVVVASHGAGGEAAHAIFSANMIVMYADYHRRHPEEYKLTLLHEIGHFRYSKDHSRFEEYFGFLTWKQKSIEEKILPDTYEEFLYCTKSPDPVYTYACGGCGTRSEISYVGRCACEGCDQNMLLVGGL